MDFSHDGKYFVLSYESYDESKTLIFDTENNYRQLASIESAGKISFSSDSKLLIIGSTVYPVDDNFKAPYEIKQKGSSQVPNPFNGTLSPDDKYYIYSEDEQITILDASALSVRLTSIKVNPGNITLGPNESSILKVIGIYSDGTQKALNSDNVTWDVGDFYIAKVLDNKLYGVSTGKTILKVMYGDLESTVPVVVAEAPTMLSASIKDGKAALKWAPVNEAKKLLGYYLYRRTPEGLYSATPITDFPIQVPEYTDKRHMQRRWFSHVPFKYPRMKN